METIEEEVDPRIDPRLVSPTDDLELTPIWRWNDYQQTTVGFFDLICDWTEIYLVRLICGKPDGSPIENKSPILISDALRFLNYFVPKIAGSAISEFLRNQKKMEKVVFIIAGFPQVAESDERIRKRKCGIKLVENENSQFISLLSNAEIMENRLFPKKPIWDEKIIDHKLASLRSNPTNYWTFALHAAHEVYTGYWYERVSKHHGKGHFGKKRTFGEFSKPNGIRIMKNYGCYMRHQIRAFRGLSKEQQQVFANDPKVQQFLIDREMTKTEFYDEKLHIYIFGMLEPQIKGSFNFGIDFIQLEYNLVGSCPFFVDRDFIITAIENFHTSVILPGFDLDIVSKFIIGNGENGLFGKIGIRSGNENTILLGKERRERAVRQNPNG